ncbi:hypothetical protein CRI94_16770 [Longibacter salinarum]|uniref:Iron-binding zinc finger CDGSH type domain-containing protein n=1 Tax=Longibacter salinarum TaxID=1850348 RepID=A0A2A8CTA6_9BACT|nr:CDGSH iron-sulfur domain-containing protein [Longibacter salinarum]PEN11074.1 hypothetical protein CRI94_16770 [Longibacter salinarum]
MERKTYTYQGEEVTVTWDQKRCIHAEECVKGLPEVFDPERRPWIDPDKADAASVADVVQRCPTGALHVTHDGVDQETAPTSNHISVEPDGPLYVRGRVEVLDADGDVLLSDTRIALCRCGLSSNKPLCDGSHSDGFEDRGALQVEQLNDGKAGDTLRIQMTSGGPLLVEGSVTITGSDSRECSGSKGALCRCGASGNKPFCDGSHTSVDTL